MIYNRKKTRLWPDKKPAPYEHLIGKWCSFQMRGGKEMVVNISGIRGSNIVVDSFQAVDYSSGRPEMVIEEEILDIPFEQIGNVPIPIQGGRRSVEGFCKYHNETDSRKRYAESSIIVPGYNFPRTHQH